MAPDSPGNPGTPDSPDDQKSPPRALLVIGGVVLVLLAVPGGVFTALFILSLVLRM
ncbi:hypothetical protein [Corynebacterium kalidii]